MSRIAFDGRDVLGFWTWEAGSDCIKADTVAAHLFNFDPEEAETGLPLSAYVATVHAPDRQRVLARFREDVDDDGPGGIEYRVCANDGVLRLVLWRGRFVYDHLGHPIQGHGIVVDITDLEAHEGDRAPSVAAAAEAPAAPLDDAADAAITAFRAVAALNDPTLTARAEALLFEIGRKLAAQGSNQPNGRLN